MIFENINIVLLKPCLERGFEFLKKMFISSLFINKLTGLYTLAWSKTFHI